ncbi:unnamed protein product [Fraxinus pennsylvanica]|uniref:DNA-directed RNA polymerase RpoA/D/Rpb3-type domain-containing protein n=1 Tax=Fraxinus pennsylvanica TaxID=56036 RepID=A0AAD2DY55_9LAMI|nr:unnamed protein product [Fraxinus pennsylvanica]
MHTFILIQGFKGGVLNACRLKNERTSQPCLVVVKEILVKTQQKVGYQLFACIVVVLIHDAEAYTYDEEVIKKAESMGKPGLVEIRAKEDSFIFTVESTGAIKASQLLLNAIDVLKQKLDAVRLSADTVEADEQFGELGAHMRGG